MAPTEGGGPVTLLSTGAIAISRAATLSLMGDLGWLGECEEQARRYLLALAADALSVRREQPIAGLPPIAVVVACSARQRGHRG